MNAMLRKLYISNAVLWSAAIVSADILDASTIYSAMVLPVLAFTSLLIISTIHRHEDVVEGCTES